MKYIYKLVRIMQWLTVLWNDEWTMWYNTHTTSNDIDSPVTPEQRKALDLSSKREKRNWHNIWAHLDKHAQGWWD